MSRRKQRSRKDADDERTDPEQRAREIALHRLSLKPYTREELARVLRRKGIPPEVVDTVLDRLTEVQLIDDEAYAQAWVESRHTGRGLARKALAHELRNRGVDSEVVDEAVNQLDSATEEETARRMVQRRLASTRHLEPERRARRLAGMLARKGYPASLAFRVVSDELRADGESADAVETLEGSEEPYDGPD